MKHLGLFEGIGGFSLAARWMGWETKAWVEIDPHCQKIMKKNFPESIGFSDIKTFNYAQYKSILRSRGEKDSRIDIVTGGFPCQPFSIAGKRKGNEDERALWYEMYRIIQETKPLYVVAENVTGLLTIQNGLVFERVCLDLENEGYTVQAYILPACATDAPHRRDRVWIVAKNANCNGFINDRHKENSTFRQFGNACTRNGKQFYNESNLADGVGKRLEGRQEANKWEECNSKRSEIRFDNRANIKTTPNPKSNRWDCSTFQEHDEKEMGEQRRCRFNDSPKHDATDPTSQQDKRKIKPEFRRQPTRSRGKWANWYEAATELCRVDDGIPPKLDKLRNSDRAKRLKALGNAIVPQVAYQIFKAIEATEEELFDTPSLKESLTLQL